MAPVDYGLSQKKLDFDEKKKQILELEGVVRDFLRMAQDLDHQIKIEQQISGVSDEAHFAYPPFAKAAASRRDNLRASIRDLELRLEKARLECEEAQANLPVAGAPPASEQTHARFSRPRRKGARSVDYAG